MRRVAAIFSLVPGVLAAVSGCALGGDAFQERTEALYPFARDSVLRVEHTDGTIHVYGWKEPQVKLIAVRKAYSAVRLHQVQVETEAGPNSIVVRTHIAPPSGIFGDRSGTVDYTILVPESARLEKLQVTNGEIVIEGLRGGSATAELENGKVTALNCFADVRVHAINGMGELFFDWWENSPAHLEYVIGYGMVRAKLPRQARFSIDARSDAGNITDQFGFAQKRTRDGSKTELHAATAPEASMSLLLRSARGNISIDRAK